MNILKTVVLSLNVFSALHARLKILVKKFTDRFYYDLLEWLIG